MNDLLVSNLIPDDLKSGLVNLLINNTPVAYIILDEEYRVQFINENFLKLRKLNRDAVMGEICYNISNGGTPCKHCTHPGIAVSSALPAGSQKLSSS